MKTKIKILVNKALKVIQKARFPIIIILLIPFTTMVMAIMATLSQKKTKMRTKT